MNINSCTRAPTYSGDPVKCKLKQIIDIEMRIAFVFVIPDTQKEKFCKMIDELACETLDESFRANIDLRNTMVEALYIRFRNFELGIVRCN